MNKQHRENLDQFFGGYLHQNWDDFYADSTEAVAEFLSDYPPDKASQILTSLGWLLDQELSEEKLDNLLLHLHNAYYPLEAGETYEQWLIEIYNPIAKHLGKATIDTEEKKGNSHPKDPPPPSGPASDHSNYEQPRPKDPPPPRTEAHFAPYPQKTKELSILIGVFFVAALLCLGIIVFLYAFFRMLSMNQVKNAPPTFRSPTPTIVFYPTPIRSTVSPQPTPTPVAKPSSIKQIGDTTGE